MDELKARARELAALWAAVVVNIKAADDPPAELGSLSIAQLDEAVRTAAAWIDGMKAPRGFVPNFNVAKASATNAVAEVIDAVRAFEQKDYAKANRFVARLVDLLNAIHMMAASSPESREAIANLGGKLAESLALVETAQRELADKVDELRAATDAATVLRDTSGSMQRSAEAAAANAGDAAAAAKTSAAQASELAASIQEHVRRASELESDLQELKDALKQDLQALAKAHTDAEEKSLQYWRDLEFYKQRAAEQTKLIDDLLPKGASAGLAAAFAARVGQVERTKWIWLVVFVASITVLAWTAAGLGGQAGNQGQVWQELLQRLPLAAPLVWLGWFSAIQYGNVVRIQEDYAFKEATSKAFAGYRDHMQHMASVGTKEASSAMALLSERTIEILAREPLRIYGKTERDATPSQSILESLSGLTRKEPPRREPPANEADQ